MFNYHNCPAHIIIRTAVVPQAPQCTATAFAHIEDRWVHSRGRRSHFSRLRSCSDTGYHRSNQEFTHVFTSEMTRQIPATAKIKNWLCVRFFHKFLTLGLKEKRRILPESNPALRIYGHRWYTAQQARVCTIQQRWEYNGCGQFSTTLLGNVWRWTL